MGATGMLLLEDPGLQGFIPEEFAPLNFQMAGGDILDQRRCRLGSAGHGRWI
jgi:hypothetical protein